MSTENKKRKRIDEEGEDEIIYKELDLSTRGTEMIYRPVVVKDSLKTALKRWMAHVEETFNTFAFVKELVGLILEYGTFTLCDLLGAVFGCRFVMIAPAPIGAAYGDISAQWYILPSSFVELEDTHGNKCGHDYSFGLVSAPVNNVHMTDFEHEFGDKEEQMDDSICFTDCELLAVKPADEESQYLFVHIPTRQLYLIGDNTGSMQQIESIGPIDQSPTRILNALFHECTLELDSPRMDAPSYCHKTGAIKIPSIFPEFSKE